MPVIINFGVIQINDKEKDAGIFSGENIQKGWDTHSKNNQAIGQIFGNANLIPNPLNIISDQDIIDSPINDKDLEGTLLPVNTRGEDYVSTFF